MNQYEALIKLGLSEQEAQQTLQDDARIDRGENLFPLTKQQEQVSKAMRHTGRAPGYKFQQRQRKPNEAKRHLITFIADHLPGAGTTSIEVSNAEREINFVLDGVRYRITLSAPRK